MNTDRDIAMEADDLVSLEFEDENSAEFTTQTIQASEGWYWVRGRRNAENAVRSLSFVPIVGWVVRSFVNPPYGIVSSETHPLTPGAPRPHDELEVMFAPDGRYYDSFGRVFRDHDQVINLLNEHF